LLLKAELIKVFLFAILKKMKNNFIFEIREHVLTKVRKNDYELD